jgi:hypothetical protein
MLRTYNIYIRFLYIHTAICVPSLVEITPGVPELCWNIHTYIHLYIYRLNIVTVQNWMFWFVHVCQQYREITKN